MPAIQQVMMVTGNTSGSTAIPTTNLLFEHRSPDLTAGDGNGIATWEDHQPSNIDLSASSQPIQRNNTLNGLPTAEFGGAAQMNLSAGQTVSSFTYFAVMKCTDGNPRTLMAGNSDSPQVRINANKIDLLKATTALIGTSSTALSTSTYYKIVVTYDGTNYAFYLNNVADGSGSNAQTTPNPVLYLGARSINAERFLGNVAHQGLYNAVLSTGDRNSLNTALTNLWGF